MATPPAEPPVVVDTAAGVRTLTLNRPHRLNAFTAESYRELADALTGAEEDPDVAVVLLRGAGRAFSSGVDLAELDGAEAPDALGTAFDGLIDTLLTMSTPIVAAVRGAAVGFGATILLHCDVVIVADDARLRYPFATLGTAPEAGSSVLLPAVVGPQAAAELLYTARWVGAEEAVSLGLARRRCPADRLDHEARALAVEIAARPGPAVTAAKRLLRAGGTDAVRAAVVAERAAAGALRAALGTMGLPGPT